MLRSRKARREAQFADEVPEPAVAHDNGVDPEHQAVLADAVGPALLVVLETLAPAERTAFVLHDLFGVPFEEIATIVDRSPMAARQLASRARRRVQGASTAHAADRTRQGEIVDAFLAASRGGDFGALLKLLDPEVILRADDAAMRSGMASELQGATAVANIFAGRARAAQPALIDGTPGLVWAPGGTPRVVFAFTIVGERIVGIDMLADPDRVSQMEIALQD